VRADFLIDAGDFDVLAVRQVKRDAVLAARAQVDLGLGYRGMLAWAKPLA
jgi:hypothetical protein